MISIMFELEMAKKAKEHLGRNWPLYLMGAGIVGTSFPAEKVADELIDKDKVVRGSLLRAGKAGATLSAGATMKAGYDRLKKKKRIQEVNEVDKTAEQTAKVIEKTGGRRAVGHLKKHWKKYAALAGAGVVTSIAGEGERLASHDKIRKSIGDKDFGAIKKASDRLRRAEVIDNIGTAVTVGGGAAAGAGKLYNLRAKRRK